MNQKSDHVFVWPLCTRIIHWTMALSFLLAFVTAFYPSYFKHHIAFGFIFGIMILFRIIWGFMGPQYATFNTFKFHYKELKFYFAEKINNRWRKIYAGHNPASSWFTVIVLSLGSIIVISGLLLYGVQEGKGLFSGLNTYNYTYSYFIFRLHLMSSYLLLLGASIHIIGIAIEQWYHKSEMLFAMISGYKKCEGKDTYVSKLSVLLAFCAVFFAIFVSVTILYDEESFLTNSKFEKIDFQKDNAVFYEKCGKCHKNYPPFMLPEASWIRVVDELENHFGEKITDNNISITEKQNIKNYLVANSAENSTRKISFKTLQSLGKMRPISITKSTYWRELHQHIDVKIFERSFIKNKSNCFACHHDFEYGMLEREFIKIPE